jgi:hypothetical protein
MNLPLPSGKAASDVVKLARLRALELRVAIQAAVAELREQELAAMEYEAQ